MSDFGSIKGPGVGGKTALKPHRLNGAVGADEAGDQFFISRLGKIFRFQSAYVLTK